MERSAQRAGGSHGPTLTLPLVCSPSLLSAHPHSCLLSHSINSPEEMLTIRPSARLLCGISRCHLQAAPQQHTHPRGQQYCMRQCSPMMLSSLQLEATESSYWLLLPIKKGTTQVHTHRIRLASCHQPPGSCFFGKAAGTLAV